jgi:tetratricopeptide (TPR) repeat protein
LLQRTVRQQDGGPTETSYDLHPIVRRYAYDRLSDRAAVHGQLVIYFEAVPQPQRIQTLDDLQPTIELYHHLIQARRYDEARVLFQDRLQELLFYQLGAYQAQTELLRGLFPDGEAELPRLMAESDQSWTLNELANSYTLSGQPERAVPLYELANELDTQRGDKANLAIGLGNLAFNQQRIGHLEAAVVNLRRRIAWCQEMEDRFSEAYGHKEYGLLLATTGNWVEAKRELDIAQRQLKAEDRPYEQGEVLMYRAQAFLWQGKANMAFSATQEALQMIDEWAKMKHSVVRGYIQTHWLMGWAQAKMGQFTTAQGHLDEALRRCRAINLVELEPSILLAQARLAWARRSSGTHLEGASHLEEATQLAREALTIAERAGYVLNQADIHNFLAAVALATGQRDTAYQHAQQAHDLAYCDGPPYVYKPALDEAERLLDELSAD